MARVYGLKHSHFLNIAHMRFMMNAQEQLKEVQESVTRDGYPMGSCGHPLVNRPLWMVGKYYICFNCYTEQERNKAAS